MVTPVSAMALPVPVTETVRMPTACTISVCSVAGTRTCTLVEVAVTVALVMPTAAR